MDSSAARIANLLGAAGLAVADRLRDAAERTSGLAGSTPAALTALAVFADGEPIESLRRALALSQPGAVRAVDRLAGAGLVERRPDPGDGRQVRLHLTARGRRVAGDVLSARAQALDALVAGLGEAERERLGAGLEALLASLTSDHASARRLCRMCDAEACGHPERCPVTRAVMAG
jgi:MarR family transcriptional repressor of emrRAB